MCWLCHFQIYAVKAAVRCGFTKYSSQRKAAVSCGRSRTVYVLIAINTVLSRSSRYIAVSGADPGICERGAGVSPSFPLPFPSPLPFSLSSPSPFRISAH